MGLAPVSDLPSGLIRQTRIREVHAVVCDDGPQRGKLPTPLALLVSCPSRSISSGMRGAKHHGSAMAGRQSEYCVLLTKGAIS